MTRQINCPHCASKWQVGIPGKSEYTISDIMAVAMEETVTKRPGKLLVNCVCDRCSTSLPRGSDVVCISIHTTMNPYFAWEHQYIECPITRSKISTNP